MKLSFKSFEVHKQVPLAISRGAQSSSMNWEVRVLFDGIEGIGEAAEYFIPQHAQPFEFLGKELERAVPVLRPFSPWQRMEAEAAMRGAAIASSALAGIDMALHDWIGKAVGQPVWRLLGLPNRGHAPVSFTIGISSPQSAQQRWAQWLEVGMPKAVKVKLGSPDGIDSDKAMFEALLAILPTPISIGVDANGGWTLEDALHMCRWLADRRVDHVEQPTHPTDLSALRRIHEESPLPILVDESCRTSGDIPLLADACDGINIKLLKCGGISEAMRMIHCARAHGLRVMLGCYSQTVLGNTAANQLAALVDYIDLDSHLNLKNDPYMGCRLDDGVLFNRDLPGLGVTHA